MSYVGVCREGEIQNNVRWYCPLILTLLISPAGPWDPQDVALSQQVEEGLNKMAVSCNWAKISKLWKMHFQLAIPTSASSQIKHVRNTLPWGLWTKARCGWGVDWLRPAGNIHRKGVMFAVAHCNAGKNTACSASVSFLYLPGLWRSKQTWKHGLMPTG